VLGLTAVYLRREAEVAGKLPQALEQKLDLSKLVIPRLPDLRIDTEDFNDPWHVHSNANNEMQENGEYNPYDDDGGSFPPMPTWQPTSRLHSHHPSVALSTHHQSQSTCSQQAPLQPPPISHQGSVQPHLPPSHQGSIQPHLPPSCQGSVQPHLHPGHRGLVQSSTPSHQGSVSPPSHAMDQNEPQDEALIYEQSHLSARVSKKRQLVNVGGSNEPNAKQKAKKVP